MRLQFLFIHPYLALILQIKLKFQHYSELSRSPKWRKDYLEINIFRYKMYIIFILYKIIFHPIKFLNNIKGILTRNFNTKMEMSIYKLFKLKKLNLFR